MVYLFLQSYFSKINDDSNNDILLRDLAQKTPEKPIQPELISLPTSNLLQTLYSDSPSNNYYYAILYIGKNRVKQTYLIDTEVETISSPCAPCEYCGKEKTHYFFDPQNELDVERKLKCGSRLCKILPAIGCTYPRKNINQKLCSFLSTKLHGEGMRGYYITDIVYFEEDRNMPSFESDEEKVYRSYNIPIGCSLGEYGKYRNISADGIMGMNYNDRSFINVLYNLKIIEKNIFSLCLGHTGGYMSLGKIYKKLHNSNKITYFTLLPSNDSYTIKTDYIDIGKLKKLKINSTSVIDTGTPISYFPNIIFKAFLNAFETYCMKKSKGLCGIFKYNKQYGYCALYENEKEMYNSIKSWPNIELLFDKVKLNLNPKNYFYKAENNKACLGINNHTFLHVIIGSNFMREYDFIFDREKNRVGFVKAKCSEFNNDLISNDNKNKNKKKNDINNNDNIIKNKVSFVKNGIEFFQGQNDEIDVFKDNIFIQMLYFVGYFIIILVFFLIVIFLLYNQVNKQKYENLADEDKKFNQI